MGSSAQRGYAMGGVALLFAFLLGRACAPEWTVNPQYGYGWFIPLIVLYLIRFRLRSLNKEPFPPSLTNGTVVIVSLLALISLTVEWGRLHHPPLRMIMGIQGAVWLSFIVLGWRDYSIGFRRAILFPALLLLTAVPWPTRIEEPLTRLLMSWVTGAAIEFIHFAGVLARREGELIIFPNAIVGVSEACSGIRSLQASFVFALILGEWRSGDFKKRLELLFWGLFLALSGNLLRTLTLCWIASSRGMDYMERWHDPSGTILLFVLIGGLLLGAFWRIPRQGEEGPEENQEPLSLSAHLPFRGMKIVFIITLTLIIAMNFTLFFTEKKERESARCHLRWIESQGDHPREIPSEVWRNLRASSGEWVERKIKGFESGRVEFYHFYWSPIRDSQGVRLHRPDWCMKGIGWKRVGEPKEGEMEIQGGPLKGYWIQYRKPGGEALQFWTLLRNQERVSIDFNAPALVEDFNIQNFLFPKEQRSPWEMISLVVSNSWEEPTQRQAEEIGRERIRFNSHLRTPLHP